MAPCAKLDSLILCSVNAKSINCILVAGHLLCISINFLNWQHLRYNGSNIRCRYRYALLGKITRYWYFSEYSSGKDYVQVCQSYIQYIPRNMHTVFALMCFVVVIHWLIFPYPSGLLHWHCGNLTIAPVPAKQPWWIWINTSCEFIMNDCITTTKQSTTKPCVYFLGYTVMSKPVLVAF